MDHRVYISLSYFLVLLCFTPAVGILCNSPLAGTPVLRCRWSSVPTDTEDQLYSLPYIILFKGLEHLQILVSEGGSWNKSPVDTKG